MKVKKLTTTHIGGAVLANLSLFLVSVAIGWGAVSASFGLFLVSSVAFGVAVSRVWRDFSGVFG